MLWIALSPLSWFPTVFGALTVLWLLDTSVRTLAQRLTAAREVSRLRDEGRRVSGWYRVSERGDFRVLSARDDSPSTVQSA